MAPRRSRRPQAGQSLAEFVLVLPVWLALVVGLIQLTLISQALFMTRHAVQVASRVYAACSQIDSSAAMRRSREAAAAVMKHCKPMPQFQLSMQKEFKEYPLDMPRNDLKRGAPRFWRMKMTTRYPLIFSWPWTNGHISLEALVGIQNEQVPTLDS